ncbi:MAG TPA: ATP-dependent protease ATPase subunit HslU [bacterium]|nr:ATP-dependent protease ATPase subunit HslU [bacterium]
MSENSRDDKNVTLAVLVDKDELAPELTPRQIVQQLDRYIVGQKSAKKVVAIALRNRTRRSRVGDELRDEIIPKNILMIGPTGVGKTEIARRLSSLMNAPFIKVEATKYTEVGYVGRDVESMVRDLMEAGIRMIKKLKEEEVREKARDIADEMILDALLHDQKPSGRATLPPQGEFADYESAESTQMSRLRDRLKKKLLAGELDGNEVEIEVQDSQPKMVEIFSNAGIEEMGINVQDMLGNLMPKKSKKRKVTVQEAREILISSQAEKLIDMDVVTREASKLVEQSGIIFIDEIDKIAGREKGGGGPDVSREGVQRDILPIVEGSTVMTKYGPVRTNHILFIAAGAFSLSKPSDLVPELQGRFPLRVELSSLSTDDFKRILTEPRNALVKQYVALLAADGVDLNFTEDGIEELAKAASMVNQQTEDIGARRLHTLLEKVLEDVSFDAPDSASGPLEINSGYVKDKLKDIVEDVDLSRYIL